MLEAPVFAASSSGVAEKEKILENTFRIVSIDDMKEPHTLKVLEELLKYEVDVTYSDSFVLCTRINQTPY